MRHRFSASVGLQSFVLVVLVLATAPAGAQTPQTRAKPKTPAPAATPSRGDATPRPGVSVSSRRGRGPAASAEKTPDGRPDMQGFWTNATFTPFERPSSLAGKEFFSDEEAAAFEQKRLEEENNQPQDDIHYDNVLWLREKLPKVLSRRRTSLVVDPPDGRVPPQTPEARQRAAVRAEARKTSSPSDVKSRTLTERCIIW